MARRSRPVTFAEAIDALHHAYLIIQKLLYSSRLGPNVKAQLEPLRDVLRDTLERHYSKRG
jgi:hypothetical protein